MKKILIILAAFLMFQSTCLAQTGITFLYINGSNNNDLKMKNWYENGVKKLHPHLKKEFEVNDLSKKYFLKNNEYFIQENPAIFFWGDKSHRDLTFVEKDLEISKTFSPWLAYQVRFALTRFLHDAIWVQKYHNMLPVLEDLHVMIKDETQKGHSVVLYGYSAGSFITYEYMLTRLPFIDAVDFFNNVDITPAQRDFVAKRPMKKTCMRALAQDLAVFSATGHIVPNKNDELFKEKYMNLNNLTDSLCTPDKALKGVVNFASPLVLFYSDISDPKFEITYYNKLLIEYLIEQDMFWLTVNYREDPLGFPCGRNLSVEELEAIASLDIEPHAGFIYDKSNTKGRRGVFSAHTSYWSTGRVFSKAVVSAYIEGYTNKKKK